MANPVCDVLLTERSLEARALSTASEMGGIVDFWGVVRATEEGAQISGIDYEAHAAMAEHQLRAIAEECAKRFELMQIIVEHRVGFVPVGEASLFVRVGSRHRAEAFRASQWIVDELKKRVPIWKHPRAEAASEALRATS
ncbi:MAG: molybdenum cofactor biosynthesis protein MoaE [Verrucomicrobiaceae bacterium]|nr:molybdenum cofactor biosynthesis protein MoaE [Verrucomicrobiaceae bacterium]